jgi:hypothetical protein
VLFHSSQSRHVEYRAFADDCALHSSVGRGLDSLDVCNNEGIRIVFLPVPYDILGGEEYYCTDNATFLHRPFMTNSEQVLFVVIMLEF